MTEIQFASVVYPPKCADCGSPSDNSAEGKLVLRYDSSAAGMYEVRCGRCWVEFEDKAALQLLIDRLARQPEMARRLKAVLDGGGE